MKDTSQIRPPTIVRFAMGCLIGILSVPAFGEKGSFETACLERLAEDRDRLEWIEVRAEVWRYEVFEATSTLDSAWTARWARALEARFPRSATGAIDPRVGLSFLIEEARTTFGSRAETAEMLSEVHRRDAGEGMSAVWERRSGAFSKFTPQGTWHQAEGSIAIGPPLPSGGIEISLSRLGLLVPEQAKALSVPSGTPESSEEAALFQVDDGETRLRFGARPWRGEFGLSFIEELPLHEEEEGETVEARYFFRFGGRERNGGEAHALPEAALEFSFGPRGSLVTYAIVRIHPFRFDPEEWEPFPSARPPFGWKVLDYRFLPEKEYQFGRVR